MSRQNLLDSAVQARGSPR